MNYRILIAAVVAILISSCAQTPTALEYNAKIVSISDSLKEKGMRWGMEFNNDVKTRDFSKLTPLRKDIENFANDKISELSADKDIHGSGDLKQAMLNFLACEKELMQRGFLPFEKLSATATDNDVQAALDNIKQQSAKEQALLDNLRDVELDYAKKNNIALKPRTY